MHNTTFPCGTYPPQPPKILLYNNPRNDAVLRPTVDPHNDPPPSCMVTHAVASAASSWLRRRRIRYLLLVVCSPLLLVLLCAALPFLCAAELCLRRKLLRRDATAADRIRCCEEGREESREEKGLLHRYLEDQLFLVRSIYKCGEDDEEEHEDDSRRFEEDVQRLGCSNSRIPLLR